MNVHAPLLSPHACCMAHRWIPHNACLGTLGLKPPFPSACYSLSSYYPCTPAYSLSGLISPHLGSRMCATLALKPLFCGCSARHHAAPSMLNSVSFAAPAAANAASATATCAECSGVGVVRHEWSTTRPITGPPRSWARKTSLNSSCSQTTPAQWRDGYILDTSEVA